MGCTYTCSKKNKNAFTSADLTPCTVCKTDILPLCFLKKILLNRVAQPLTNQTQRNGSNNFSAEKIFDPVHPSWSCFAVTRDCLQMEQDLEYSNTNSHHIPKSLPGKILYSSPNYNFCTMYKGCSITFDCFNGHKISSFKSPSHTLNQADHVSGKSEPRTCSWNYKEMPDVWYAYSNSHQK